MKNPKKRWLVAGVAAATLAGGAYAFAATLNVTSNTLAAGSAQVGACNANAAVSYTTVWNSTLIEFDVGTVTVTTPASQSCGGLNADVALTGSPAPLPFALPAQVLDAVGSATWTVPPGVPVANVTDVHVAITG